MSYDLESHGKVSLPHKGTLTARMESQARAEGPPEPSSGFRTHLLWKALLSKPNPIPIPYDVSYSLYAWWAHLLILYL